MREHYRQELSRVLNVSENVLITLSCISPASAVFILLPVAIAAYGSATFISYGLAALIGIAMAFC